MKLRQNVKSLSNQKISLILWKTCGNFNCHNLITYKHNKFQKGRTNSILKVLSNGVLFFVPLMVIFQMPGKGLLHTL